MKKKIKLKNLFMLCSLPFALISSLSLLACKTPPQTESTSVIEQLNEEQSLKGDSEKNWHFFLQDTAIKELLNFVFDNEEEKNKYIESQKVINSSDFLKHLQTASYYYNDILSGYLKNSSSLSLFGFGKKAESDKPYIFDQSKQVFKDLFNKNWLWLLFNMDKLSFVFNVDIDLFKYRGDTDKFEDDVLRNNVVNGAFYHPTNPQFLQYAKKISSDNLNINIKDLGEDEEIEYRKELEFYLLNSDGMIIKINIIKTYDANKKLAQTKVELFPYLYTYPKLLASEDKNRDFSLSKYIQVNGIFSQDDKDYEAPTFEKILFQDQYGGDFLQYAFIGVRKTK